jgi:drug/metabolite transporter (DMT)-like permease
MTPKMPVEQHWFYMLILFLVAWVFIAPSIVFSLDQRFGIGGAGPPEAGCTWFAFAVVFGVIFMDYLYFAASRILGT